MMTKYSTPASLELHDLMTFRSACFDDKNYLMTILSTYRILDLAVIYLLQDIEMFESWEKGIYADIREDFVHIAEGFLGKKAFHRERPGFIENVILLAMLTDDITPEDVLNVLSAAHIRNQTWLMHGYYFPEKQDAVRMIELTENVFQKLNSRIYENQKQEV